MPIVLLATQTNNNHQPILLVPLRRNMKVCNMQNYFSYTRCQVRWSFIDFGCFHRFLSNVLSAFFPRIFFFFCNAEWDEFVCKFCFFYFSKYGRTSIQDHINPALIVTPGNDDSVCLISFNVYLVHFILCFVFTLSLGSGSFSRRVRHRLRTTSAFTFLVLYISFFFGYFPRASSFYLITNWYRACICRATSRLPSMR